MYVQSFSKNKQKPKSHFFPLRSWKVTHTGQNQTRVFFLFVFVFNFFLFFSFLFVFYIIKGKKNLLQSSFTNIVTDSLGVMEQVSREVFYLPWKVLKRRQLPSPQMRGATCLLRSAKCVLYDTAGQKELVSGRWPNQSSHGWVVDR